MNPETSSVADHETVPATEITLESLAVRLDQLGMQMNWLCENLQSLFLFVQAAGQNGGGIRGMIQALKHAPADLLNQQVKESQGNE